MIRSTSDEHVQPPIRSTSQGFGTFPPLKEGDLVEISRNEAKPEELQKKQTTNTDRNRLENVNSKSRTKRKCDKEASKKKEKGDGGKKDKRKRTNSLRSLIRKPFEKEEHPSCETGQISFLRRSVDPKLEKNEILIPPCTIQTTQTLGEMIRQTRKPPNDPVPAELSGFSAFLESLETSDRISQVNDHRKEDPPKFDKWGFNVERAIRPLEKEERPTSSLSDGQICSGEMKGDIEGDAIKEEENWRKNPMEEWTWQDVHGFLISVGLEIVVEVTKSISTLLYFSLISA